MLEWPSMVRSMKRHGDLKASVDTGASHVARPIPRVLKKTACYLKTLLHNAVSADTARLTALAYAFELALSEGLAAM